MLCIRASVLTLLVACMPQEIMSQGEAFGSIYQQCNQTIFDGQGIITSPNFPSPYPQNAHCMWLITVESGRTVVLGFRYFNIEKSLNCQYDRITIYNGLTTDHPVLGRFCGPFRPGDLISTSNKMLITLDTDSSSDNAGFYATFHSADPVLAKPDSCGGLLTSLEGYFHTPNYPKSNYPPSVTCSWHIKTTVGRSIQLSFDNFDLEESTECKYDAVTVYTGWTSKDATEFRGRFCGGTLPASIQSSGNEMFVTFASDASGFATGFQARYATKKDSHDAVKTAAVTTTPTTATTTTPTMTPQTTLPSYECPSNCPSKSKLKAKTCSSTYITVVQILDVKSLRSNSITQVKIIKPFKMGSLPEDVIDFNLRIACRRCSPNIRKKGLYVIVGSSITAEGIEIRPSDMVIRFKKKHNRILPRLISRCRSKRQPKRRQKKKARSARNAKEGKSQRE